tara:strand:- start:268 stop:741 length:474 start_codon:yes stop_codon:yes gene_type:complete
MRLISHRGNVDGKYPQYENLPEYVDKAIDLGYDCEVDLWVLSSAKWNNDDAFYLGHDEPTYPIDLKWLTDRYLNLWIHCKDLKTISKLRELQLEMHVNLNYFFHNTDDCTITSRGDLWVYPGKQPVKNSIAVMPEYHKDDISEAHGVCSDYIKNYKK